MIRIDSVSKAFIVNGQTIQAVDQVSLEVKQGDIYGIIGYSGAGKSTLIRMINQLEKQNSGHIWIDGIQIETLSKQELEKRRMKIGMIFQHFNLLSSKTVAQNIAFPLEIAGYPKSEIQTRVNELLDLVGLNDKKDTYPAKLSGGQKQRVGIARALANKPDILLCDEATSALDPETTRSILDLLKEINQKFNLTIVMISHEMRAIQRICTHMSVMENGKIVESGLVSDLFSKPTHPVTRRFVMDVDDVGQLDSIVEQLKTSYPNTHLLYLSFNNTSSREPIIYKIISEYHFPINILQGSLSNTHSGATGHLLVGIDQVYDIDQIKDAFNQFGVEVIHYEF